MSAHLSKLRLVAESPLRAYAREAVAVASQDQVRGVLTWRIAQYLLNNQRVLSGRPTADLALVPPRERHYMQDLARGVLREVDRIEDDPPAPSEVLRHNLEQSLVLARAKARLEAEAQGHKLDVWRPTIDDPRTETAFCLRCRAGVAIHQQTAHVSASAAMQLPCARTGDPR